MRTEPPPARREEPPPGETHSTQRLLAGWGLVLLIVGGVGALRAGPLTWAIADPAHSFAVETGATYTYPFDYDTYGWLRQARNLLQRGMPCDSRRDGVCRDDYTYAPLGAAMHYADSLHIDALAWTQRLTRVFDADYPLMAGAIWLQVIVGALGVIPAFWIAARFGSLLGGVVAALTISLNGHFLARSLGADNDVWNVVLPLYAFWALTEACRTASSRRCAALTVVAALLFALHARIWSGWVLAYAAALGGTVATLLLLSIKTLRAGQGVGQSASLRRALLSAACLVGVVAVSALAFGVEGGAASLLSRLPFEEEVVGTAIDPRLFPSNFKTVSELGPSGLDTILSIDGAAPFWGAWLGLALLLFRRRARDGFRSGELLLAAWLVVGTRIAFDGIRFTMLLLPPLGIALGAGFAIAHAGLCRWAREFYGRSGALGAHVIALGVAAVLLLPLRDGLRQVKQQPLVNDLWVETLEQIRSETPSEAIVNAWWDYGYFIKYFAERRVSADGATLRSRVPHWFGRALLAPTERETLGWLRMLNCGSDAFPEPEGEQGAFGRLQAAGLDAIRASDALGRLVTLERKGAEEFLSALGLDARQRGRVLAATHCAPPASVLLLSNQMIGMPAWWYLGNWDPIRAAHSMRLRALPAQEALSALGEEGRARSAERAIEKFVANDSPYLVRSWIRCDPVASGERYCPIGAARPDGLVLVAFVYPPAQPSEGFFILRKADTADPFRAYPSRILIADAGGSSEFTARQSQAGPLMIDVENARILIGPIYLMRAAFTHLMFLDGRGMPHFEPMVDRASDAGERLVVYRIRWPSEWLSDGAPQAFDPS